MNILDEFIKDSFNIIRTEYKQDHLDFNKLDYISNHYDCKIKSSVKEFKNYTQYKDLIFEIQVRTLNQHAWSNTSHTISYKQELNIPVNLKRRIYRLLSLYELADDEFSGVNNALKGHKDNYVYTLLRKLEGKFYKFAKCDFDRDISLKDIDIILNYCESEKIKNEIDENIENFLHENEKKIKKIFTDNKSRFHEILFITQPEIFIIWYLLQKYPFTIEDNWDNDFEPDDLEQIKTLWGNEL